VILAALPFGWRLALAVIAVGSVAVLGQSLGASFQLIAGTDVGVTLLMVASLLMANAVVRVARRVSTSPPVRANASSRALALENQG
jgi:hypothetical protein